MTNAIQQRIANAREIKLVIDGDSFSLKFSAEDGGLSIAAAPIVPGNKFYLQNNKWSLTFAGQLCEVKDSVGLGYIHNLIGQPNCYVDASKLVMAVHGETVDCAKINEVQGQREGEQHDEADDVNFLSVGNINSQADQVILDSKGRKLIQDELDELMSECESLRVNGEGEAAEEKMEEIEKIKMHLKRTNFFIHNATFANKAERDRKSVTLAIRRAIKAIGEVHPALAKHLTHSVKTGLSCCYKPETETSWHS